MRRLRYGRPVSFRLQEHVVDEFAAWAAEVGIVPGGEAGGRWRARIAILLQGRATYLGRPDPTRWRSGDVHELFMTYVAPRQVDAWDLVAHGLDTIRDFLRFLDATDRLHPASTRVSTLLKELDRLAPKYAAAMADTSRWRLAKRVFTAILADGIDLDAEPAVLDAWAERFNARDTVGRRAVLGELIDQQSGYATARLLIHDGQVAMLAAGVPLVKHLVWPDLGCDCGCEQQAQFPPVALPDPATLAKLVATDGADLLRQLAALVAWAGDAGKAGDGRGEPRKADRPAVLAALGLPIDIDQAGGIPALTRLWRLAIEFDVIQLRRTRAVPGTGADLVADALAGDSAAEQVLDLWSASLTPSSIRPPRRPCPRAAGIYTTGYGRGCPASSASSTPPPPTANPPPSTPSPSNCSTSTNTGCRPATRACSPASPPPRSATPWPTSSATARSSSPAPATSLIPTRPSPRRHSAQQPGPCTRSPASPSSSPTSAAIWYATIVAAAGFRPRSGAGGGDTGRRRRGDRGSSGAAWASSPDLQRTPCNAGCHDAD